MIGIRTGIGIGVGRHGALLNLNIVSLKSKTMGYWRMNETSGNAIDSLGINTGIATSINAYDQSYVIANGYQLLQDTTKRRVYCGAISKTKYTVSIWAKIGTIVTSNAPLIGVGSNYGGLWIDPDYNIALTSNAGSSIGTWPAINFVQRDATHLWILEIDSVAGTAEVFFDLKSLGKLTVAAPALTNLVIGNTYRSGTFGQGAIPAIVGNCGLFDGFLTTSEKGVLFNEYKENYYPFAGYNPIRKGNIAFTFDDGYLSCYDKIMPEFAVRGVKGSFYIATDKIIAGSYNGVQCMTWTQLLELNNAGNEIGYHGQTHIPFTSITDVALRAELDNEKALFLSHGIPVPTTLAYPNGAYTTTIKLTVSEYVKMARGVLETTQPVWPYELPVVDKFMMPTINPSASTYDDISVLKSVIDLYRLRGTNLILMWHNIVESNPISGGERTRSYMNEILDYCLSKSMHIMTLTELYTKYA